MPASAAPLRAVARFVLAHWRRQPGALALIVGTALASTAADVATPVFAGRLVTAVSAPVSRVAATHAALAALAGLALMGLAALALRQAQYTGMVRFTLRMMRDVEMQAFARVQRFATAWHAGSFTGATVRQITRGTSALDMLNDVLLILLLPDLAVLAGVTLLLATRFPLMGAAVGVASMAYVAVTILLSLRWVAPASAAANAWDTRVSAAIADAITCNATVKAFGAEAREEARLGRVLTRWQRRTRRAWLRGTTSYSAQSAALLALQLTVTGAAAWLWWIGRASAGDVAMALTTYFVLNGYLSTMGQTIRELQRSLNDMAELVALAQTPLTITDRANAPDFVPRGGEIVFSRVTFGYGAHPAKLFRDLSIRIAPGERVGLVGPSGSGKSTFVRLIQRLHDLDHGAIAIDGQNIAEVGQASLRRAIAIVPQDPILFHRSLAENIAYGRPGASRAEIEQAARLAHAHDFISRQPMGYATLVGERGIKLSGGERQRVALARAFLAGAPILILDEATSSLDSESEAAIQHATTRLMAGRTALVVAHRLSTVRAMDRILVFEAGRIIEEGTHDALIARDGRYRRLFETQALGLVASA